MADTYVPVAGANGPTFADIFAHFNQQYLNRANSGTPSYENYRALGNSGALVQGTFGVAAQKAGLTNLYQMLLQQGRVDPRLLASAQAANSRSTQAQMDASRGSQSRSGMSGSGLSAALQAAIGAAGSSRAANLNYQDIADSYKRNQENLGLLDQLVIQPQLGYANLGQQDLANARDAKEKRIAAGLSLIGSSIGALGK